MDWPVAALVFMVRTSLQMFSVLLLGWVLVSWLQPGSSLYAMLSRLVGPIVAPVRKWLAPVGGVDLSPMVVLLVLQVGVMLLS